jgi:molybdate transport system ATP-binding protein
MPHDPVIDIRHCTVRLGPGFGLKDASWQVLPGQHWVLAGPNGAGKTTLLRLARGEVHPAQGEHFGHRGARCWNFGRGRTESALDARAAVALVTPDDHDALTRDERAMSVERFVVTGIHDTQYLFREPSREELERARAALASLDAADLAGRDVLSLSRGQGRLAVLARALVREPRLLLLDEAMQGLDAAARARLGRALARLAAGGTQLVMATHHLDEVRAVATHAAVLEGGQVVRQGAADAVLGEAARAFAAGPALALPRAAGGPRREVPEHYVALRGVDVVRQGRTVLAGIDWTVRPGEHWAVLGANGAGKSTLVALCQGALRPTRGRASWFGLPGPVNVWDIRRRMGLVSPELQAAYRYDVTAVEAVLSGHFSSVGLYDRPSAEQVEQAGALVDMVGLAGMRQRRVRTLSYGQMRRLLIARALAPGPELLLLDEACTGLDPEARARFLEVVQALAGAGVTLVFVTHDPAEIPPAVGLCLRLEAGRVVARGPRERVLAQPGGLP